MKGTAPKGKQMKGSLIDEKRVMAASSAPVDIATEKGFDHLVAG
ncbi:hypothetical protein [Rhizobium azibense]|nr:hypothetical protein [Rhizobium azibense]